MTFAIFYNSQDLQEIQRVALDSTLAVSQADKTLAVKYWNGGLKNWQSAPLAQSPYEQFIATNTARLVIISGNGLTLFDFRNLLYRIAAANPSVSYLKALADDMGRDCGGVEPWPVV